MSIPPHDQLPITNYQKGGSPTMIEFQQIGYPYKLPLDALG